MIRLATFNVQHGRGPDGVADAVRLARAVAALDADVVALQEVDRGQLRSGRADLARVAAEVTGCTDHRFVPALAGPTSGRWGVRRRARGDEPSRVAGYGIALLTRYPVRAWHRLRLPREPRFRGPGRRLFRSDEPRAAVAAELDTPDGPLTVVGTHLSSGLSGQNLVQLAFLRDALGAAPRPLVLLGDLNLRGEVPAQVTGWRPLATALTYPVGRPRLQIDHVLADGPNDAGGYSSAVDTGLSDHRALIVDVTLT